MRLSTACCFICIPIFLFVSQLNAQQTKIAILESKIAKSEGGEKLKWLDSLSTYIKHERSQEQDSILRVTLAYAIKLDSINVAGRQLADLMDFLNNIEGESSKSLKLFKENSKLVSKVKNPRILAAIYLNAGDSYFFVKDYKTSIAYYDSTMVWAEKAKDRRLLGLAIMYKASNLSLEGNFAQASQDLQRASRIFIDLKDTFNIISAKNTHAVLYSQNGFYEEAGRERDEAIQLAKMIKNESQLISFYYNAATDAQKTGNSVSRIENLKKSLELAQRSIHRNYFEKLILLRLSTAYSEQNNIGEAEKYFDIAMYDPEDIADGKEGAYLEALKKLLFAKQDYKQALQYGLKDLALKREISQYEEIMNAEKFLSQVYERLGNSPEALRHFQNFSLIRDSVVNIQNGRALSYYQTIYETEKRDLKIEAQQTNIALLNAENREKNQWILFGGLGLISTFVFIILIRSRNNAKHRQHLQEGFSQDLIQAQENERTRVARELHDSVGQKLMLLTKKTKTYGNPEMESLAGNTLEELRAISRGLHPASLERMGPTAAIRAMIDEVDSNTDIFFTHEIDDIDSCLSKEASLHLYRIIQEVLTNMLKHAEAKAASILIERKENSIETTIQDNGKGFEFSEKLKSGASLGMKTLLERAKILNSKIEIKSQPNKGTTVILIIPS